MQFLTLITIRSSKLTFSQKFGRPCLHFGSNNRWPNISKGKMIMTGVLTDAKWWDDSKSSIKIQIKQHLTPLLAKKQVEISKIPDLANFWQFFGHEEKHSTVMGPSSNDIHLKLARCKTWSKNRLYVHIRANLCQTQSIFWLIIFRSPPCSLPKW